MVVCSLLQSSKQHSPVCQGSKSVGKVRSTASVGWRGPRSAARGTNTLVASRAALQVDGTSRAL
eukprot:6691377-Prymnesium_polylepis.1